MKTIFFRDTTPWSVAERENDNVYVELAASIFNHEDGGSNSEALVPFCKSIRRHILAGSNLQSATKIM
jgi:hypothetical protein